MSLSATLESMRCVSDVMEFLQRPGNDFGRDFMLATGTDPLGDLAILSNPVVRSFASSATTTEKAYLGSSQAPDTPALRMLLNRRYTLLPFLSGEFTYGFVVSYVNSSVLDDGKARCLAGRFVLCAATGEYLSITKELLSERDTWKNCGEIVFDRFDSLSSRRRYVIETLPGMTFLQVYKDYERGDLASLARHFLSVEVICEARETVCPACNLPAAKKCACKLVVSRHRASFDYEPAVKFHKSVLGMYCGSSALYYRQTAAECGTALSTDAIHSIVPPLFARAEPSLFQTHSKALANHVALELAVVLIEDRIRYGFALEMTQGLHAGHGRSRDICPALAIDSQHLDSRRTDDQVHAIRSHSVTLCSTSCSASENELAPHNGSSSVAPSANSSKSQSLDRLQDKLVHEVNTSRT